MRFGGGRGGLIRGVTEVYDVVIYDGFLVIGV